MAWILPSWRFAWRTLSARPARSLLLAISIALAASLVTAVSTGLQTAQSNLEHRMVKLLGAVDVRLVQHAGAPFDADIVERVRTWPGVQAAQARLTGSITLLRTDGARDRDARQLKALLLLLLLLLRIAAAAAALPCLLRRRRLGGCI